MVVNLWYLKQFVLTLTKSNSHDLPKTGISQGKKNCKKFLLFSLPVTIPKIIN